MLVISRDVNEVLLIGDNIRIVVIEARDGRARIGIEAPREIKVDREEVKLLDKSKVSSER